MAQLSFLIIVERFYDSKSSPLLNSSFLVLFQFTILILWNVSTFIFEFCFPVHISHKYIFQFSTSHSTKILYLFVFNYQSLTFQFSILNFWILNIFFIRNSFLKVAHHFQISFFNYSFLLLRIQPTECNHWFSLDWISYLEIIVLNWPIISPRNRFFFFQIKL